VIGTSLHTALELHSFLHSFCKNIHQVPYSEQFTGSLPVWSLHSRVGKDIHKCENKPENTIERVCVCVVSNFFSSWRHHLAIRETEAVLLSGRTCSMCRALGSIPSPTLKQTNKQTSGVLVAHTCNPSCSGGRDQEDQSSKPDLGR
jgi:hypothetical protein